MYFSKKDGFTILEILVSVAVLVFIMGIAIVNFRNAEKRSQLTLAVNMLISNIRKTQSMVINGSSHNGVHMPSGGYGINFAAGAYTLFADNDADKIYDAGEEMAVVNLPDVSLSASKENLLFLPPSAQACINDDSCAPCTCDLKDVGEGMGLFKITVTHNDTGDASDIKVNQISGRVGVE